MFRNLKGDSMERDVLLPILLFAYMEAPVVATGSLRLTLFWQICQGPPRYVEGVMVAIIKQTKDGHSVG